ncbi:MAG TPA: hypothetical protein VGV92_05015 [Gammaproteobacteria bacterium]|nr:hypothetical protein [Gammaproteobacteria bacterium]
MNEGNQQEAVSWRSILAQLSLAPVSALDGGVKGFVSGMTLATVADYSGLANISHTDFLHFCVGMGFIGASIGIKNEPNIPDRDPPQASLLDKMGLLARRAVATRIPHTPLEGTIKGIVFGQLLYSMLNLVDAVPCKIMKFLFVCAVVGNVMGRANEMVRRQP